MGEIFFVFKMIVATFAVVFLLQVQVGNETLENHAMFFVRHSAATQTIQEIGADGWKVAEKATRKFQKAVSGFFDRDLAPGNRQKFFSFDRNKTVKEEQARREEQREVDAE